MQYKRSQQRQAVLAQLQIGQSVFLAPESVTSLPISDIKLREYGIEKIPKVGSTLKVVSEKGAALLITIDQTESDSLRLGVTRKRHGEQYFAFLSEDQFWNWWECSKLDQKLRTYFPTLALPPPSRESLALNRLLYDLLINHNLQYQNVSCKGCLHGLSSFCMDCVRSKERRDYWIGVSGRGFLFR